MTTVHISLGRDDGTDQTAAKGVVEWEPTTRREDGTMVILERGFTVPLVAGEATVTVDPSGLTWCWRVTERTDSGGTVRYVSVPDSATTVEYVDLPDVDPDTLLPWTPADPEAAYTAALAAAGGSVVADDTPAAPAEGTSATYFVTSAVSWPAGLEWSTDPDGDVAPTITGTGLVSMFTIDGTTRAVLGATFPALPPTPDETAPTAGTLSVVMGSTTADLTVAGATDETALAAAPYAYSMDNGSTWTAYQAGSTYGYTGLTPETSYTFRHKVEDAAGNETVGTAVTDTTDAAPSDTTPPTAGTLAGSSITDTGFTLAVTGATDETALDSTPYAFSTDNGATYSAWQASNVFAASGLTAQTGYQCVHKVRDAALNVSTGTAITVTTEATVGTTLFTDFSEYTTGAAPSDWSEPYATSATLTVEADAAATGGKVLKCVTYKNVPYFAAWDAVLNTTEDVEVVARYRTTYAWNSAVVRIRASGGAGTESNYYLTQGNLAWKYVNGADLIVLSATKNAINDVVNAWLWVRFRANGTTLQYRTWADGDSEPTTWREATDTSLTAGLVGVGAYQGWQTYEWVVFGVGLNGATAPMSGGA